MFDIQMVGKRLNILIMELEDKMGMASVNDRSMKIFSVSLPFLESFHP